MSNKRGDTKILIDATQEDETRLAISKHGRLESFEYETDSRKEIKGNIYLAKITRVEPSLQAAFIEYGNDKHGFLPFTEIHPDYYNLLAKDKEELRGALLKQESEENSEEASLTGSDDLTDLNNLSNKLLERPEFSEEEKKEETQIIDEDDDEDVEKIVQEAEKAALNEENESHSEDSSLKDENELLEIEKRKRYNDIICRYKIQDVIKKNQVILVQATKEDRGTKSASFTSYISLAGRYSVLMPNSFRQSGVSRRIDSQKERSRMKSVIDSLEVKAGASVIMRTAGIGRSKVEIKRDYDYLVMLWNDIVKNTVKSKAPAFIHEEGNLITRAIRDLYRNDSTEIVVDGEKAHKEVLSFMKMLLPNQKAKVTQFKGKTPIFTKYGIEQQISALYNPIATLNSGGYVVINQTEALVSIDVNSGRATGERDIEETATRTNLEAAIEIARQIRLRNLSGLIVVDFIDMEEYKNRRSVENLLRKVLQNDKAKTQIRSIGQFGLLEMSRQRLKSTFLEANTKDCGHCMGRGFVRSNESNAKNILRTVESELSAESYGHVHIFCHENAAFHLLNQKREQITALEKKYDLSIEISKDASASADSFSIETIKKRKNIDAKHEQSMTNAGTAYSEIEEEEFEVREEVIDATNLTNQARGQKKWQKIDKKSSEIHPDDGAHYEDLLLEKSIENIVPAKGVMSRRNSRRKPARNAQAKPAAETSVAAETAPDSAKKKLSRNSARRRNRINNKAQAPVAPAKKEGGILKGLWKKLTD